jgi:hypothetical protein
MHLSVGAYRTIGIPLDASRSYRGVRKLQGPRKEFMFSATKMHFIDVLNAWRSGTDRFAPLATNMGKEFYDGIESQVSFHYNLEIPDFGIHISGDTSAIPENLEEFACELVEAVTGGIEAMRALEPLYRHVDESGNRLWVDRRMQSKEYYQLGENLARDIVRSVKRIAKKYDLPARESGGFMGAWREMPAHTIFVMVTQPNQVLRALIGRIIGFLRYSWWKIKRAL